MGERLRTTAALNRGRAVGVLAAIAVLGTALAAGWTDRLTLSMTETKLPLLRIHVHGDVPAGSPTFQVSVLTMRAQLSADPAVSSVRPSRTRRGASSLVLLVRLQGGGRKRDAAITRIERNLDPGSLTADFRGPAAAVRLAKDQALDDLALLLAAVAIVALVAALSIGLRAGGAALLAAAAAAALAVLACELAAEAFDVSWLSLVGAGAGAILVSLQLTALAACGARPAAVWASGVAAAAVFATPALLGVSYLGSFALGGGLGALLAIPLSIVAAAAALGEASSSSRDLPWSAIGGLIGFSRGFAAAFAALAVLLVAFAAAPLDRLATAAIGAPTAPAVGALELALSVAVAALVTIVLAIVVARRFWLALLATLAAALPALAVVGLLVVSFQQGGLESPLDYVSSGSVQLGSAVAAVTAVAALGAAQVVALAWAARSTIATQPEDERVAAAIGLCAPAAAVACAAGIAAGIALGFAAAPVEKQFGLALAAGLLLELLIAQALVGPALLRLTVRSAPDQ